MKRRGIADTGPIVALLDRRDGFHDWARAAFDAFDAPLATCEAVVTEACFLLSRAGAPPRRVLELVEAGVLDLAFSARRERPSLASLMQRYENVPMSFADACLVRMAELAPRASLLTLDRDFTIYRRSGRSALALVAPFR